MPVQKDANVVLSPDTEFSQRVNLVYAGTTITRGKGMGIVVAVLSQNESFMGTIFKLLDKSTQTEKKTPLQNMLKTLAKYLTILSIFLAILITILAIFVSKM